MTELQSIIENYNELLDKKEIDEATKETFLTMVTDIKTDFEMQIKQIEKNNLLLDGLVKMLPKIRTVMQAIKQNDRIVYY